MGIPGILKEIGKGERIALAKLAVEHLESTQRPLRIAIDAAIWNFQTQAGQGGKNPALRTLYYRLLKLLALPIHPLFVYDGKNKPLVKRGRTVSRWGTSIANETSKKLIQQFRFPCHVAPGEAEAECALLQRSGIVDMVMSQDGDAIMFGSQLTLRDWSKEGTRGNKSPTHVNLLDLPRLKERTGLDPDGMILVALLSGGDYDQDGVAGFGAALACEAARAGFGADLLDLVRKDDKSGLREWRERLQYELETNESGCFKRRHKTLKIPDSFPDRVLVDYYINPAVSNAQDLSTLERKLSKTWDEDLDIPELRRYVGDTFDWQYKPGAWKFVRSMAPPLLAHTLRSGRADCYVSSIEQIRERRQHFTNDGIPELRVAAVPAKVVGLDLDAEEDSPEFLARLAEEQEQEEAAREEEMAEDEVEADGGRPASQPVRKQRKSRPWSPHEVEKMWIPETVVQLGVPALVEEWHQNERDKLADPKKFATRKCKKTTSKAATTSRGGGIEQYFAASKAKSVVLDLKCDYEAPVEKELGAKPVSQPKTPTKKVHQTSLPPSSPDIKQFFGNTKPGTRKNPPRSLAQRTDSMQLPSAPQKHSRPSTSTSSFEGDSEETNLSTTQGLGTLINAIEIISSPPAAGKRDTLSQVVPTSPRKLFSTNIDHEAADLPASVTGRKKPLTEQLVRTVQEANKVAERSNHLESFFLAVGDENAAISPLDGSAFNEQKIPADPSTGLKVDFVAKKVPKKVSPVPRESLPGTWKDVDLDEEVLSTKSQRQSRVSYVDLTKD